MAWNKPGDGDNGNQDPWGGRDDKQSAPPDLDEVVRKLQNKLSGIFGGGKGQSGSDNSGSPQGPSSKAILFLVGLVLIGWGLTGIYIIDPAERGVVLRFGAYSTTTEPGPHWHLPYPIESVVRVDVDQIRTVEVGYRSRNGGQSTALVPNEALMLTQDENIVDIQLGIQYKVKSAQSYLFNLREPDLTLREATESAIREVVGKGEMDFVLTEGRGQIAQRAEELIQLILDRYQSGLIITSVNMQDAQPPEQVQGAFHDAVKAREDEERLANEAQAYANDVIPKARGAAARQMEEAEAYKARVVASAEGEVARFDSVLAEYAKAPQVTRERIYIEGMEAVLSKTSKVLMDVKGGNSLMYLPLDRLMEQGRVGAAGAATSAVSAAPAVEVVNPSRVRNTGRLRSRERQ
ncbi:MAG: FtsH protease activity modulator HflK [Gammaproteobacteria bacterium]|nr:FtsH protease activity modulator HflK [Gammaproteobacteria bacterium]